MLDLVEYPLVAERVVLVGELEGEGAQSESVGEEVPLGDVVVVVPIAMYGLDEVVEVVTSGWLEEEAVGWQHVSGPEGVLAVEEFLRDVGDLT